MHPVLTFPDPPFLAVLGFLDFFPFLQSSLLFGQGNPQKRKQKRPQKARKSRKKARKSKKNKERGIRVEGPALMRWSLLLLSLLQIEKRPPEKVSGQDAYGTSGDLDRQWLGCPEIWVLDIPWINFSPKKLTINLSRDDYGVNLFSISKMWKLRYGARNEFSQRPVSPEITVQTSFKSLLLELIAAPNNNSKTISVMLSLRYGAPILSVQKKKRCRNVTVWGQMVSEKSVGSQRGLREGTPGTSETLRT